MKLNEVWPSIVNEVQEAFTLLFSNPGNLEIGQAFLVLMLSILGLMFIFTAFVVLMVKMDNFVMAENWEDKKMRVSKKRLQEGYDVNRR